MKLVVGFYVICCVLALVFAETIHIRFDTDQLTIQKVHQLIIEMDGIQLEGLSVSPAPKTTSWTFDQDFDTWEVSHLNTTAGGDIVYCLDKQINQFWTYLQYKESSFTLHVVDPTRYNALDAKDQGSQFTFYCPVRFIQSQLPASTLMSITYTTIGSTEPKTIQQKLAPQIPEFLQPTLKASISAVHHGSVHSPFSGTSLLVDFETDNLGPHLITIQNGPKFYPASYSTGKPAPFFCTSPDSSDPHFARIEYVSGNMVRVHVNKYPAEGQVIAVSCNLYLRNEFTSITDLDKGAKVSVSYAAAIAGQFLDIDRWPSNYRVDVKAVSKTHLTLKVVGVTSTQTSTTPINKGSVITYQFSDHLDISTIELGSADKAPLGFHCDTFVGTIYLNTTANSVDIRDVLPSDDEEVAVSPSCTFSFSTTPGGSQPVFDFHKNLSGGVSVFIDWVQLYGHYGYGHGKMYSEPFYITPAFNLTKPKITSQLGSSSIHYSYTFTLGDQYDVTPVLPRAPKLIISLLGPHEFSAEQFSAQLNCTYSDTADKQFVPFEIRFDSVYFAWVTDLTMIRDTPRFSLNFRCTRSTPTLMKYGFMFNPSLSFVVQVIDLIDSYRYVSGETTSPSFSIPEPVISQPLTDPGEAHYPKDPVQYLCASGNIDMPNIHDVPALHSTFSPILSSTLKAAITKTSSGEALNTLTPLPVMWNVQTSLQTSYKVQFENAHEVHQMFFTELKNEYIMPEVSGAPVAFTSMLEVDPLQSILPVTTAVYSNLCYYTTKPFSVVDDGTRDAIDEFRSAKEETQLQTYSFFLSQDGDLNFTSPVIDLATSVPRLDLPAFKYTTIVDKKTTPTIYNKITECGWLDGIMIRGEVDTETHDFSPFSWKKYSQQVVVPQVERVLCAIGEKCKMNADCDQSDGPSHCVNGQCSFIALKVPDYVDYKTARTEFLKRRYFEDSREWWWLVYVFGVAIVILLQFIFVGCYLCNRQKNKVDYQQLQEETHHDYPITTISQENSLGYQEPLMSTNSASSIE